MRSSVWGEVTEGKACLARVHDVMYVNMPGGI